MRHQLWLAILVVATIGFTLVFACAAPFAAFGAAAALTLSRRDALLTTGAVWLANQATGYLIVGYPWSLNSVAWGPTIGVAAVLGTLTALWVVRRMAGSPDFVRALAALVLAFGVYEVAIFLPAATVLGRRRDVRPAHRRSGLRHERGGAGRPVRAESAGREPRAAPSGARAGFGLSPAVA